MFNIQLSCQNPDFGLPKTSFTWVCMQRAKFRQGMRRWDLWTGPREAHTRLEEVPVVMAHRLRALGRWPKSHHCRFPVTLVMLTSRFGPWALQNVLDMAVGAVGLVCLSLYRHYWLEEKKETTLMKMYFQCFLADKATDSFLLIPSNLLPLPFGISCLPCLYIQLQGQSCLQQSLSLIYLNFIGMSIQGQHLSWCLNICLFPSIWSSFQVLFSLIAWIVFAVSDNEFMPKSIAYHVLYCLDRVAAGRCLSCPLKWGCLSLTFHLWGKCLQLLCWYILSFMLEKFFRFCCGWVMSDV